MAETPDTDKLARRDPDAPAPDPIVSRSTSAILLVSALLLTVVFAWSLYDEVYGMRPWKSYQQSFVKRYDRYLRRLEWADLKSFRGFWNWASRSGEFEKKLLTRTSLLQYLTFQFFAISVLWLFPVKLLLRLLFTIKYIWVTPWFNV